LKIIIRIMYCSQISCNSILLYKYFIKNYIYRILRIF